MEKEDGKIIRQSRSTFINPFTDIGFKLIFGRPASKDMLIMFLNILLRNEYVIEDLTFLDKEDHGEGEQDTSIVYDLYCRTDSGEHVIIEMQQRFHPHFLDRTLYYVCRAIRRQVEQPLPPLSAKMRGKKKEEEDISPVVTIPTKKSYRLNTVIGIFLMNFIEPGLDAKFRTDAILADIETGRCVNKHLRQIYLQFPFFKKELADCKNDYDRILYMLQNMNTWNRMPAALKGQVFERLAQLAKVANLSEADQIAYDRAIDSYSINEIAWEEDMKKSREEGREEGIKKVARELKQMGLLSEAIQKATGLSPEEIAKL